MSDMSRRESKGPVLPGQYDFGYVLSVSRMKHLMRGGDDSAAKHYEPPVQSV